MERSFVGTADQFAAHQTMALPVMPGTMGIPLGIELTADRAFHFNPFQAMRDGHIDGLVTRVIADRNMGKTALLKAIGMRYGALKLPDGTPYRVSADNVRRNNGVPEYKSFAQAFDSQIIDLSSRRINFLDPEMGLSASSTIQLCMMVLEHIKNSALEGYEPLALRLALWQMDRYAPDDACPELLTWMLGQIDRALLASYERELETVALAGLPAELVRRIRQAQRPANVIPEDELLAASGRVRTLMIRLLDIDYKNMFGRATSLSNALAQQAVVLDYTGLSPSAVALIQSLIWTWRSLLDQQGDTRFESAIDIHDENYVLWDYPVYARAMYVEVKKSRAKSKLIMMANHRLSDGDAVGSAGSEQRDKAVNLINDTDIFMVGRQPSDQIPRLKARLGLNAELCAKIPDLKQGQFICKMGTKDPVLFQFQLSEFEKAITFSNQANHQKTEKG